MKSLSAIVFTGVCLFVCVPMTPARAADAALPDRGEDEIVEVAPGVRAWQAERRLSLAMRSDYVEKAGLASSYSSLALTGQLRWRSSMRPYSASLLFERSFIEGRDDSSILAVMLTYEGGRWSMSLAPYLSKLGTHTAQWREQSTLRFRLSPRSAVGLELIGPLDDLGASKLLAGYYGKPSKRLATAVTLGSVLSAGPDLALRLSVTWQIR